MSYFRSNINNNADKKAKKFTEGFLYSYVNKSLYKNKSKLISFKSNTIKKIAKLEKNGKKIGLKSADKYFKKHIHNLTYSIFNSDEINFSRGEIKKVILKIMNA